MGETQIDIDDIVAAKVTGGTTTLTPHARDYVLSVLGEGASHEMDRDDHIFSAYPDPDDIEEGEEKPKVRVSMADPSDSQYGSTILSDSKILAEKVAKALEDYVPQQSPNAGGRRKKRKTRKTRKTRKGKKMTRRR